jgi:hypothetical protein
MTLSTLLSLTLAVFIHHLPAQRPAAFLRMHGAVDTAVVYYGIFFFGRKVISPWYGAVVSGLDASPLPPSPLRYSGESMQ